MTPSVNATAEIRIEEWRVDASRAAFVDAEIDMEDIARSEGRILLTLDTVSDGNAELLYRSLDFIAVGVIPPLCTRGADTRARKHDDNVQGTHTGRATVEMSERKAGAQFIISEHLEA